VGPLEVAWIVGAIWLVLSVLVIRRRGWLLGVIVAFTLVPAASGALFYTVTILGITVAGLSSRG
jgi:hypothetical protein